MTSIVRLVTGTPLPPDFPDKLRKLADDVEAGHVTAAVVGIVAGDGYAFMWPSAKVDSLVLTSLMQASAIERMKA